jgi:hypothetical protein
MRGRPVILLNTGGVVSGCGDLSPGGNKFSPPPKGLTIVPELGQRASDFCRHEMKLGASLPSTSRRGVRELTGVLICGAAASISAESTARQARSNGTVKASHRTFAPRQTSRSRPELGRVRIVYIPDTFPCMST